MKEISVEAEQVKRSSISDLRTAARNEGIFGDTEEEGRLSLLKFPALESKYTYTVDDTSITIQLEENASKDSLIDIRSILELQKPGNYHVWLNI